MRTARIGAILAIGLTGLAGLAATAAPVGARTLGGGAVCTGGAIAPGIYQQLLVVGVCSVPQGTVTVTGNLTIAPGALLDATTPTPPAALPGTVVVGGNVLVGSGAVLFLGCDAAILCPSGTTAESDIVAGNIIAVGALGVVIHAVYVQGSVSVVGGGGGAGMVTPACLGAVAPAPWSQDPSPLAFFPVYTDVEDSTIGGNLRIIGLQTCYLGALRNHVQGNVLDQQNQMGDPDANEVVGNSVTGNMVCTGSLPQVQFGESGAAPNQVGGQAIGQCGFGVQAPDINYGTGGPQPISVPMV